jgi:hypothetical protein
VEKLSAHASTDTTSVLLLSLNKRISSMEERLSGRGRAGPVDTDVPTSGEASFRTDACAPLYSSFSRSALNDVLAPGNQVTRGVSVCLQYAY